MSKTASGACLLVVLAFVSGVYAQGGRTLGIRPHRQHTMVWCWGASSAAVAEFELHRRIEDCEALAAYDQSYGGPGLCCANPAACLRGAMPGEVEQVLSRGFGIHGHNQPYPASFDEVRNHLDTRHPIVVWLWHDPSSAHVVVIDGYRDDGTLHVLDPMQGPGWVPYDTLRMNYATGMWQHTIFVDGADEGPDPDDYDDDGDTRRDHSRHDDYSPPRPVAARFCCTPVGVFGPSPRSDVPVGAPCNWMTPMGMVFGQACN